jgi:hypothetical protein
MKFRTIDEQYFARRSAFAAKHGGKNEAIWSRTDYWPLYCGFANLARYVAILDIVRKSLTVPGHIAEMGVYRGANLLFVAKLMRLFDPMGWKQVHRFDSVEGLTTFSPEDRAKREAMGAFAGSYEELKDLIALHELDDEVVIHKGLIQETLPPLLETRPELSFSLVFCDTDLYEPTKLILESLHEKLAIGGMFVCDEWNYELHPGETRAVSEFLSAHPGSYRMEHPLNTRHPTLILSKIAL